MKPIGAEHVFNDDLLIPSEKHGTKALDDVRQYFSDLAFAFDFPELRDLFKRIDAKANAAKKRVRLFGACAVLSGAAALLLASALPVLPATWPEWLHVGLSGLAAFLGIVGAFVGLIGIGKQEWLEQRYCTERMRQFFFQNTVLRLPDVLDAQNDKSLRAAFIETSKQNLKTFEQKHIDDAKHRLREVVGEKQAKYAWVDKAPDAEWLLSKPDTRDIMNRAGDAVNFNRLYRDLRIAHQISYASSKLGKAESLWKFPLRKQEFVLAWIVIACVGVLLFVHVAHAAFIAVGHGHPVPLPAEVAVIWIAIIALTAKAFEEGLQPQREVERYEDYASNCWLAWERFREAAPGAERYQVMLDFERLVFEEMKHFLRTNHRARFVI